MSHSQKCSSMSPTRGMKKMSIRSPSPNATVSKMKRSKSPGSRGKRPLSRAQKAALAKGRAALEARRTRSRSPQKTSTKSSVPKPVKTSEKKEKELSDGLWSFLNFN